MTNRTFTKFKDSEASRCRWSEYAAELVGDWDVIWDGSTADYQGKVRVLSHKEGKFAYLEYEYGSCSGCDGWEEMDDKDRRADFKNCVEYFDDVHDLQRFVKQVKYGSGFEEAVEEYMFHAELEKELKRP